MIMGDQSKRSTNQVREEMEGPATMVGIVDDNAEKVEVV